MKRTPGRLPRVPFTPYQLRELESSYKQTTYLSSEAANVLANKLDLMCSRVSSNDKIIASVVTFIDYCVFFFSKLRLKYGFKIDEHVNVEKIAKEKNYLIHLHLLLSIVIQRVDIPKLCSIHVLCNIPSCVSVYTEMCAMYRDRLGCAK